MLTKSVIHLSTFLNNLAGKLNVAIEQPTIRSDMITKRMIMERICDLEASVNILEEEVYNLTCKTRKKSVKKTTKKAK